MALSPPARAGSRLVCVSVGVASAVKVKSGFKLAGSISIAGPGTRRATNSKPRAAAEIARAGGICHGSSSFALRWHTGSLAEIGVADERVCGGLIKLCRPMTKREG